MKKYNMVAAAQLLVIFFGGGYAPAQTPPGNGYYRAGSDFRNDGEAVGW